jgi:hypothetical protein
LWFFSDGCKDTSGYSGIPGAKGDTLSCMSPETLDAKGNVVPGPYTNIVTSNFKELGMKAILWNDSACTQWITTIDTDGCQVVPEDVSDACINLCITLQSDHIHRTILGASMLDLSSEAKECSETS